MLTEQLRVAQTISIALIVVAVILIVLRRTKGYANVRYLDNGA